MARRDRRRIDSGVPPERRYTIEEARTELYGLVNEFAHVGKPSKSLLERAVEIGPHRRGGAVLVPEVDALAAERRIEELEQELEDIGLALLLEERLAGPGERATLDEVAAELGLADFLAEERARHEQR